MKEEFELLTKILSRYIRNLSNDDDINIPWLQHIIKVNSNAKISEETLIEFLRENGFNLSNPQFCETEESHVDHTYTVSRSIDDLDDEDEDDDFDPTAFLIENKEIIQNTELPSRNYEDNTWLIDKQHRTKDSNLFYEIVEKNMGLVEKLASRYVNSSRHDLEYDDLVSIGKFGLFKAIERFNPELGYQFSTYATHWIRQSITRAIVDEGTTIRVPVHIYEKVSKLIRIENLCIAEKKKLDIDWVCEQLEITPEKYYELKKIDYQILGMASLHSVISAEDEDSQIIDFLEYDSYNYIGAENRYYIDPVQLVLSNDLQMTLNNYLDQLTDRESEIIKYRFGIHNGEVLTLEEIGQIYGVTRERIRQIESKALRNLRNMIIRKKINYDDLSLDVS